MGKIIGLIAKNTEVKEKEKKPAPTPKTVKKTATSK